MAKNKKMYRLFFAVELDPLQKTQLLSLQDSLIESINPTSLAKPLQLVNPDNFHITLCFLGDTAESLLEELTDHIRSFAITPFKISVNELIYWPKSIVLGLSINDPTNQLLQSKKLIEKKLNQLNIFSYDKKPFEPHITLIRQLENFPDDSLFSMYCADYLQNKVAPIKVNEISLILSTNNAHGVFYETLESWPLESLSIKQQLLGQ